MMKHVIVAFAATLALSGGTAMGAVWTVAGVTFDSDKSTTWGTITSNIGYSSPSTGVVWAADPLDTVGNLVDGGGLAQNIDLTNGASGNNGRTVVTVGFDTGTTAPYRMKNESGDDFAIFEAGSLGAPEAFAVAVRAFPSGVWSQYRYEFADAYQGATSGVNSGHFATSYDLTDFGIAENAEADQIRITNMHNANALTAPNLEDRVDNPTGQGNVSQDVGGSVGFAVWQGPLGGGNVPYANGSLDADITYVVAHYYYNPVTLSGFTIE